MAVCVWVGQLGDNLAISDFPPGDHNLTVTVTDVSEIIRPAFLEVSCDVDTEMESSTVKAHNWWSLRPVPFAVPCH